MNLILLLDEDFVAPDRVRLSGRRLQHVLSIHRARPGDDLRVGALGGRVGRGTITALDADRLEMEVVLTDPPPAPLPATLLLALPRPKVLKRVMQTAAAMGVKRIFLINTWRVEKSFWESPVLGAAVLREQLILGLEQARDTILPEVQMHRRFKPFVEDELPALASGTRGLVAHPDAVRECPRRADAAVTLAIGPEGGFIPYEVDKLQESGLEAVSLGFRRLRVEQAVPALLGRLF